MSTSKQTVMENEKIFLDNWKIINEYLHSLILQDRSELTIQKYESIIKKFFTECNVPLKELTIKHVSDWLAHLSTIQNPRTVDVAFAALLSFFKFCYEKELIEAMLIKNLWRSKTIHSTPAFLNDEEHKRVKSAVENLSLRDQALIKLLLSSGCRSKEVADLTIKNVDFDNRKINVLGKANWKREVHITKECASLLQDYLQTRTDEADAPLFKNKFGKALGVQGIYRVTSALGNQASLAKTLHPHSLRHTFAKRLLDSGADLELIAQEMGHKDLNTIRKYTKVSNEDLIKAYQEKME